MICIKRTKIYNLGFHSFLSRSVMLLFILQKRQLIKNPVRICNIGLEIEFDRFEYPQNLNIIKTLVVN